MEVKTTAELKSDTLMESDAKEIWEETGEMLQEGLTIRQDDDDVGWKFIILQMAEIGCDEMVRNVKKNGAITGKIK